MVDASYVQLSDGRQVGYQEYGDRDGRPVFFFHGWIGSRLDFGPNDDIARELGMRVIAVDRPGCGSSDFQQDRRLLDWPDDVSEVADALGFEQFAVCGHSFGGPYVAACAHQLADRITSAAIVAGIRDHVVPVFISPSITVPVKDGRMLLGTWQSVVLVDTNVDNPVRQVRLSFLPG
ncbi:MAG: alpha/beta fold hydrolase [Acidobacteria bacterium]|nr:alpha/beta fold hydrolase [Acidobacteriota bacterium]